MIPVLPPSAIVAMRTRAQPSIPADLIGNMAARAAVWHLADNGHLWYWAPAASIGGRGPDDWICLNA